MGQLISDPILSRVPLFATLPASESKHLQKALRRSEIPANFILFHEGERGDRFYVVLDGQVEIVQALGTADERLVGVRGPGEYFGEMSLLNRDALRTMSVRARTRVQLLEMARADFDGLLHRQPVLAYAMASVLSARLQESSDATIR
ncbi:MAG: cyclic nucleotide-binding domain-containing protein, partial [Gammaproteobacteria bacterium]